MRTQGGMGGPMTDQSRIYAIDSEHECERLELQARLSGLERHLPFLALAPGELVLDVGCGSGSMARTMAKAEPGARVVGVDVRANYLDFARDQALAAGLTNLEFKVGDVFSLPFADATFDVVWTKYLFQWLKDIGPALDEVARVLKPGGRIVSADFVDFAVEHHRADPKFDRDARRIMPEFVDVGVGRRIAPGLLSRGFRNVSVEIETDTLFTVVGAVDYERRRNWELQWQAARARLIDIEGSEEAADQFIKSFLAHHDDPTTCTFTALYLTRGVRGSNPAA